MNETLRCETMPEENFAPAPLPDSPRVIYRRNPLVGVVCQFRFPPILKIASEVPVTFQERLRSRYPLLAEKYSSINMELPQGIPATIANTIKNVFPQPRAIGYDFISADEKSRITLTRDFLSLSSSNYTRWEDFREHLEEPFNALLDIYKPPFFSRIGLQYQNLIRPSQLELPSTTKWSELLKPHIAGMLGPPDVADFIEQYFTQTLIKFPDSRGQVQINFGFVEIANSREKAFLINNDFYIGGRTGVGDVNRVINYFNRQSGNLFRWCIQERLHTAMEPHLVG